LNSIRDIQVLCPMNRGGVGAELCGKLGDGVRRAA
jgi:hypothetical protein